MPNKLGTIPRGTVLTRTGISDNYSLVNYNGRMVYVLNGDLMSTLFEENFEELFSFKA